MSRIEEKSKEIEKNKIEEINNENIEKDGLKKIPIEDTQKKEEKNIMPVKKNNKKHNVIIVTMITLIVFILIISTIFSIINIANSKMMKGISIGGINVSDLSKEETENMLKEIYNTKEENQIYLTHGDFETTVSYEALEVEYQIEDAIKKAYNIGRTGNVFKDNFEILKSMIFKNNIEIEATIDKEMVNQISQNINNNIVGAVEQSSYYIEGDKLIITSGKEGLKVDEEQLLANIYTILTQEKNEQKQTIEIPTQTVKPDKIDIDKIYNEVHNDPKDAYYTTDPFTIHPEVNGVDFDLELARNMLLDEKEEYEIALTITKPEKTIKDLGTEAFQDKLSTYSSKYVESNVNRTTNLRLASQKINGTILLPGEEFSYNKVVGERTIQAGYKEASVYSNGQVVNGLGGGICQISSTLYNAVIMANLDVTDRRNHQFIAPYVPVGQDATVVYGSQDFKFVNTRSHPIRLEATVSNGIATISVWGIKEETEYEVSIETKNIATISYTTQYIEDANLPVGQQVVVQSGSNGRKVEAYKVVKLNGQTVSKTLLSKDSYNPMKKIVRVGTGQ